MGSLFSIPELDALPPKARRKVIMAWLRGGVVIQAVQIVFLLIWIVGCCATIVVVALGELSAKGDAAWWISVLAFGFFAILSFAVVWAFFRSELRTYVINRVPTLYGNICVACGYNLRGSSGDSCPECGEYRARTGNRTVQAAVQKDEPSEI